MISTCPLRIAEGSARPPPRPLRIEAIASAPGIEEDSRPSARPERMPPARTASSEKGPVEEIWLSLLLI